jgi:hypothetical protein
MKNQSSKAAPAQPTTAIGKALQAALATVTDTTAAAPDVATDKAAKPAKLTPQETLSATLGKDNAAVVGEFVTLAEDYLAHHMECRAMAETLVRYLWPNGASHKVWKPVIRAIRDCSEYTATVVRAAYVAVHDALPSAGAGSGKGKKGMNAARAVAALGTKIDAVIAYLENTVADCDINAAVLATTTAAAEALMASWVDLAAAVDEAAEG